MLKNTLCIFVHGVFDIFDLADY